ncbi:hypothetical protein MIZ01_1027 [Sideroxyarcus emersonii]|uniref:Uncharacterized protein n=1 Tax=Sideroxyarcus emersonii TaxID=2764705 RepID=A0AAN1X9F6_9PROT|nr:hypothetical protein [Sideroxyarcus emersonii]BCK87255.1 hypothetical protein MIZ01_1027 [Sideroxyarcus emersonii]
MKMRRQRTSIAALLLALLAGGCAIDPPEAPSHFTLAHDEFYARVRTIAIAPLAAPEELTNSAPVAEKFEPLIAGMLRDAGYKVVPSYEYSALFEQEKTRQGGYFDAYTGKQDDAKYDAVLKATRDGLVKKFNIDAVLFPRIQPVDAPWHDQWATWDGITETVQSAVGLVGKGVLKFVNEPHMYLLEGPHEEGTIKAYSLAVSIEDASGQKMYANQGGIQVLSKITGNALIPVPSEDLFTDDARNAKAVSIALESVSRAGCESDFQTSPCNGPRINVEPGTAKHLVFVVQGSNQSKAKDWERFRTEWNNTIAASAASRGLEVSISDSSATASLQSAVLAVVTINDFRYISQERYYWVGVMSGSPYIDADVDFYKLPDKTLLIRRQYKATAQSYATCSPGGICTFPPMTEKQIKIICDAIVAELVRH